MKKIFFRSVNDTPMALTREDDGEVLLEIFSGSRYMSPVQADVYIDPDELMKHLRAI